MIYKNAHLRSIKNGFIGMAALLVLYFTVTSLISGWNFTWYQFSSFWYFLVALSSGFGIQIGLYTFLKKITSHETKSGGIVAVSGTTSGSAMISCCAHYLINILPILGVAGLVSLIAQYQVKLFWLGIAVNLLGIFYIGRKTVLAYSHMKTMQT
ncbi:MAG: hypothetical protein Q7S60_04795 [bacterium]|nr:hypothetical protein [bacterium]